jgi:predicted RNase H-like nuclease
MDWLSMRQRLGGTRDSLGGRRRDERGRWLIETFPDLAQMSVIDLGGRIITWQRLPVRPKHVHMVNMQPPRADIPEWAEFDLGDVCALPATSPGASTTWFSPIP